MKLHHLCALALLSYDSTGVYAGGMSDPFFKEMCFSGFRIKAMSGRHANDSSRETKEGTCRQKIKWSRPNRNLDPTPENEICNLLPFDIIKTTADPVDGQIVCEWDTKTTCPNPKDFHLYDECYRLSNDRFTRQEAEKACEDGMKLAHVPSYNVGFWLSFVLPPNWIDPVWVANKEEDSEVYLLNKRREHQVFDPKYDSYHERDSDDFSYALVYGGIRSDRGKIVAARNNSKLKVLCKTKAELLQKQYKIYTAPPSYFEYIDSKIPWDGTVLPGCGSSPTGDGRYVFITANVYHPKVQDMKATVSNLHAICQKYCDECSASPATIHAALEFYMRLNNLTMAYLPIQMKGPIDPVLESANCRPRGYLPSELRKSFEILPSHGENSSFINWKEGLPDEMCTDYGRSAAVLVRDEGVVNTPPIGRYPVACIMGYPPGTVPPKRCNLFASLSVNGKCVCRQEYDDITASRHPDAPLFTPGTMCRRVPKCRDIKTNLTVVFIIDDSASFLSAHYKKAEQLLQYAVRALPPGARVVIFHFGSDVMARNMRENWKLEEFEEAIVDRSLSGEANTAAALVRAIETLQNETDSYKHVVLITDGDFPNTQIVQEETQKLLELPDLQYLTVQIGGSGRANFSISVDAQEVSRSVQSDFVGTLCDAHTWSNYTHISDSEF